MGWFNINVVQTIVETAKDEGLGKTVEKAESGSLVGLTSTQTLVLDAQYKTAKEAFSDDDAKSDAPKEIGWNSLSLSEKANKLNNNIKCYYIEYIEEDKEQIVTENIMIKESKVIGYMDYKNNKIVNENGVDIDYIKYEGLSPYKIENAYLVLDENSINFEGE